MSTPRRLRTVAAAAALLGFGLAVPALLWWARAADPKGAAAPSTRAPAAVPGDSRASYVADLGKKGGEEGAMKLAEVYAAWAGDRASLAARQLALSLLFEHSSLGVKLKGVLDAIAADPTPRADDPMWPQIVEQLAGLWTADTFDRGRDLMLMETRPRARHALVASFIRVAESERGASLDAQQRLLLAADFVDVYPQADDEQKNELDRMLRLLAGDDVVDILRGKNQDPDLELTADMQREEAIREAMKTAQGPAATPPTGETVDEEL